MNQFEIQHELETLESLLNLAHSMAETMGSDHMLEGLSLAETQDSLEKAIEQLNYERRAFLWSRTPQDTRGIDGDSLSMSSFFASGASAPRSTSVSPLTTGNEGSQWLPASLGAESPPIRLSR